jgi:hypothetical protein
VGWRAAAAWLGVLMMGVLVAAWILAGADGWAQGTAWPLTLDALLLLGGAGAVWGVRRWGHLALSESRLAHQVETGAGLPAGSVRGPLELAREVPPGVSPALVARGEERILASLPDDDALLRGGVGAGPGRVARRGVAVLSAAAVVVMGLLALGPGRAGRAWLGLLRPLQVAAAPVLPPLTVSPGDVELLRGRALEVEIQAPLRDSVFVRWSETGQLEAESPIPTPAGYGLHRFNEIRTDLEYTVVAPDGAESGPYTVTVLDPLVLTDLQVQLRFPPHTGLGVEEIRGDPPLLRLPRGTSLALQGRWSRDLGVVGLEPLAAGDEPGAVPDPEDGARLELDGDRFEGEWTPRVGGVYGWAVEDARGRTPEEPAPPFEIELVEDAPPEIRFVLPAADTALPVSRRQPLILEAADDYGLRYLEIEAIRISSAGRRDEPVTQRLDAGDSRQVLFRPVLDVASWDLLPGDTVRVVARVSDNRPGGRITESRALSLWLPREAELREEAGQQIEDAADLLEQLADRAAELGEETRSLERQAAAEQRRTDRNAGSESGLDFNEREDLRAALEQEQQLLNSVDSLAAELENLGSDLQESGLPDPELQAELEELQRLMEELAGEDLQARMDSLAQNLDDMSAREAGESLEEMAQRQEELREQLQQSLERFRKAAAEQELRSVTADAEELAQESELLAEALESPTDPEALEEMRQDLEERAEELAARMEDLEQQMTEAGDPNAGRTAREAGQRTEQAAQMLQQAGQQMQQGQQSQAAEQAGEASEELDQAAKELQEAQQDMAQRQMEAIQQALAKTASDALALARRQSGLREQMRSAPPSELPDLRGDQADLIQGLSNLAQHISLTTQAAPGIAEELSAAVGAALQRSRGTLDALERAGRGSGPSPYAAAENSAAGMNRVALTALAGADAMQNQASGSPQEQMMQQLQQLAQQQGQLMNQTEQVMPMELSPQQMQEQAQQLAEGQEQVAGELGEMSEDPGQSDEVLGDLEAMAELAEALARELSEGRLEAETLDRQEELFRRLLDAGRSLEKDEFSEERQSEEPGEVVAEDVDALDLDALGGVGIRFPTREELQGLTPAERQLVLQYFERLNRARGGGGGS